MRIRTFFTCSILFLLLLVSTQASAQILEENDDSYIKSGFFIKAEYGPYIFAVKPQKLDGTANTLGSLTGFELGYDISKTIALQFTYWAAQVSGNAQIGGGTGAHLFSLGATIHFVKSGRMFVFGRLGAGAMLTLPSGVLPLGVMIHAGFGIRYYTRLRHFSIGIEALALIRPPTSPEGLSLGIGIIPSLKYTF